MPTQAQVQAVIDTKTADVLAAYAVAFDNSNYEELSQGESAFVAQSVNFTSQSQFELGRPEQARTRGSLFFLVHVRKGTGVMVRNQIHQIILTAFRSKTLSGTTFFNARMIKLGEQGLWAKTGIDIPFHFQETV